MIARWWPLRGFRNVQETGSGGRRCQGAVTLTGNSHARRTLVESAWSYRSLARQTAHLKRKAAAASVEAKAIGGKAQKHLCGRYRTLTQAGKNTKLVCVAIARYLGGQSSLSSLPPYSCTLSCPRMVRDFVSLGILTWESPRVKGCSFT